MNRTFKQSISRGTFLFSMTLLCLILVLLSCQTSPEKKKLNHYNKGIEYLTTIINQLDNWLNSNGYKHINEIKGKFVSKSFKERQQFARYQYMKYYSGKE